MKQKSIYIQSFTGLRALALWAVILYHFFPNKIPGGYLGVVIFFVLSGYLLMRQYLLLPKKDSFGKLKEQYIKLTPPLLFMIFSTTLFVAFFYKESLPYLRVPGMAALVSMNNWQQIFQGLSYFELHGLLRPFTHLWALSTEMQFYLIWAILTYGNKKRTPNLFRNLLLLSILSLVLMFALFPLYIDPTRVYYGTDTRFFSFGIGALFGLIGTQGLGNQPQKDKGLSASLLLLIFIACFIFFAQGPLLYLGGMLFFSILVGLLLVYIDKDDNSAAKFLSNPLLTFFGKRAYSYYLWQYSIMLIFQQVFSHSTLSYPLQVMIQLPILFIMAEISYQFCERQNIDKKITFFLLLGFLLICALSFYFQKQTENLVEKQIKKTQTLEKESREEKGNISEPKSDFQTKIDMINKEFPSYALGAKSLQALSQKEGIIIGDSITEGSAPTLQNYLPKFQINGKVNRQMVHAIEVLGSYDLDSLPPTAPIVLQLGTNSDFNTKTLEEVLKKTQDHPVYLINTAIPDPWEESVNNKLKKAAQDKPKVKVIDWYSASKKHEDLFIEDHTHPKEKGQYLLAQVIGKSLLK